MQKTGESLDGTPHVCVRLPERASFPESLVRGLALSDQEVLRSSWNGVVLPRPEEVPEFARGWLLP